MTKDELHLEPGPTILAPDVVAALGAQPMYHQSSEFSEITDEACELLRSSYGTSGEVVVLPSSGRGAVEAALTSVEHIGRPLIVPTNGTFGRMMVTIGRSLGMNVIELPFESGEVLDIDRIADEVARHDRPILGVVHNETATGMLNPLDGLAGIVHRRDGLLLVDAVSSLGGVQIAMDRHEIDLCASASQKSVGAPPGVGLVALSPTAVRATQERERGDGHYLDLRRWWDQWLPAERGGRLRSGYRRLPWTMPTNVVLALHTALRSTAGEHVTATWQRHERVAAALRQAMNRLGATPVAPAGMASPTVGAFRFLEVDVKTLKQCLAERHKIFVATGMDADAGSVLRVAHMAESARPAPQLQLLTALNYELAALGHVVDEAPTQTFLRAWFDDAENPVPPLEDLTGVR